MNSVCKNSECRIFGFFVWIQNKKYYYFFAIIVICFFFMEFKKPIFRGWFFIKTAWFSRRFLLVFLWFLLHPVRFYSFCTVNEFHWRSRGAKRSSEFEQLKIFSNVSRSTFSFKILALFSPRMRTPTLSRLSPIFLCSFGFNQNSSFAFMKGNPLYFSKNEIRSFFSSPSIASFGASSFGWIISIFQINFQIERNVQTIGSKNVNKLTQNAPPKYIRYWWTNSIVVVFHINTKPKIQAQMIRLSIRRIKFSKSFHFSIDLTIFVLIAFLIMIF